LFNGHAKKSKNNVVLVFGVEAVWSQVG